MVGLVVCTAHSTSLTRYLCCHIDNHDGISVFDITNLSDPRYCFVCINGLQEDDRQCRIFWPLDGEHYVRAYYPKPSGQPRSYREARYGAEDEREVVPLIESIKEYKTISYATLRACWKEEYLGKGVSEISYNEPHGQEEAHVVPPLSLYATAKLPYVEWIHVPEHVLKASAKISGSYRFLPTFMQRLLLLVGEGNKGVLDLTNISMTLGDIIKEVKHIPILSHTTRYLDLSTWINPTGGQLDVSDLIALRSCFPHLVCVNAIGNGHFNSTLLSKWYESDSASFCVLWYATRAEGKFRVFSCN